VFAVCFENDFLTVERVHFALKIIFFLSTVFASLRKQFFYYRTCSLRFHIEENTIIEAYLRFRFDIVVITSVEALSGAFLQLS
jgi:hypothetical protein